MGKHILSGITSHSYVYLDYMAGEYKLAREAILQFVTSRQNLELDRDLLLRDLLYEVVAICQEHRSNKDIVHELSFLIDQLHDNVAPITRGS